MSSHFFLLTDTSAQKMSPFKFRPKFVRLESKSLKKWRYEYVFDRYLEKRTCILYSILEFLRQLPASCVTVELYYKSAVYMFV